MTTLNGNNGFTVNDVIVGIFINKNGEIAAAAKLNETLQIGDNQLGGGTQTRGPNDDYIECEVKVTLQSPSVNSTLHAQEFHILRTCYDRLGNRVPCP